MFLAAAALGGLFGALGARTNAVRTSDERILWVAAGLAGGPLALAEWTLLAGVAKLVLPGLGFPAIPAALAITSITGLAGAAITPSLDDSDRFPPWLASIGIKGLRSPIATTAGLLVAAAVKLCGRPVDFRRGMLFIDVGPGGSALALGAVAWCQARCFGPQRCTTDALARHEALHSRTVAAVGELGFYLTYVTAGVIWARLQGGPWNSLTRQGRGQPFEKTAHTFTHNEQVPHR